MSAEPAGQRDDKNGSSVDHMLCAPLVVSVVVGAFSVGSTLHLDKRTTTVRAPYPYNIMSTLGLYGIKWRFQRQRIPRANAPGGGEEVGGTTQNTPYINFFKNPQDLEGGGGGVINAIICFLACHSSTH